MFFAENRMLGGLRMGGLLLSSLGICMMNKVRYRSETERKEGQEEEDNSPIAQLPMLTVS